MRIPLALAGLTCLICFKLVSALPDLVARQSCETFFCPSLPDLRPLWGAFGAGATWLFNKGWNSAPPATSPIPGNSPAKPQAPYAPPSEKPDIELFIDVPPLGEEQCETIFSSAPHSEVNAGNTNFYTCQAATEQIIWPSSCEDMTQNTITGQILSGMDLNSYTSIDPLCAVRQGVAFWLAMLTRQQIDALMQQSAGALRAITPNPPYLFGNLRMRSPARSDVPATQKRTYLKTRDTVAVVKQQTQDESLSFLSAPPGKPNSDTFAYFAQAGAGVNVFVIDTGLDSLGQEFSRPDLVIDWIFAGDVKQRESDAHTQGRGTCVASKIAGLEYGVAKLAQLTIVKAKSNAGSFLDVLGKIIDKLEETSKLAQGTKGWTVISISGGFPAPTDGEDIAARMESLLLTIVQIYQAVIVTSAGENDEDSFSDISLWPAALSTRHDIITVGSVVAYNGVHNGRRFPWSQGGDALTVSAPGNGMCSVHGEAVDVEGPSVSSAIVSGLVAYFLSLPDLGASFRRQQNLPRAVINYLQLMSYKRYQAQESVWNGLDSETRGVTFDNWMGTPPPKKPPPNTP